MRLRKLRDLLHGRLSVAGLGCLIGAAWDAWGTIGGLVVAGISLVLIDQMIDQTIEGDQTR